MPKWRPDEETKAEIDWIINRHNELQIYECDSLINMFAVAIASKVRGFRVFAIQDHISVTILHHPLDIDNWSEDVTSEICRLCLDGDRVELYNYHYGICLRVYELSCPDFDPDEMINEIAEFIGQKT